MVGDNLFIEKLYLNIYIRDFIIFIWILEVEDIKKKVC